MKWRGDYSEDGRYLIQMARVRGQGVEYRLCYSPTGAPPYRGGLGISDTRREAKATAEHHREERERG